MTLFDIASEISGEYGIIHLRGYINENAGEKMRSLFDELVNSSKTNIILDMQGTTLINSMGIAFLIGILNKLLEIGGKLYIATQNEIIIKTLKIMGIEKFCTITDSIQNIINN